MTRHIKSRVGGLAALLGVALLVAACGSSSKTTSSTAAPAASSTPSTAASTSPSGLTISTAKGPEGTYLTGASGRAIYLWVKDPTGKSVCAGACAALWPPVTGNGTPNVSGGLKASDFTTFARSDGTKQLAFHGHALYYYAPDQTAGQLTGQGSNQFGAKWWLLSPAGAAITSSGSGASSSSSSSSSSGGTTTHSSSWG
jgi:predicted lipoprotein with Yx(FWY)xxD motif